MRIGGAAVRGGESPKRVQDRLRRSWAPGLVLMRLMMMGDVARRLEAMTERPGPDGYRCTLPPPPEGRDWEGKNAYRSAAPLLPVMPSTEEQLLMEETVGWLRDLEPTDRVILWGRAAGKSDARVARALAKNQDVGCVAMTREGVRRRCMRLLEILAERWSTAGYEVDAFSRARLAGFDAATWMMGPKRRASAGRAYSNGKELRVGRIQAGEVDTAALVAKEDVFWDRWGWEGDRPKVGRDGQMRVRKKAVGRVGKKG